MFGLRSRSLQRLLPINAFFRSSSRRCKLHPHLLPSFFHCLAPSVGHCGRSHNGPMRPAPPFSNSEQSTYRKIAESSCRVLSVCLFLLVFLSLVFVFLFFWSSCASGPQGPDLDILSGSSTRPCRLMLQGLFGTPVDIAMCARKLRIRFSSLSTRSLS